jgi:hypothetical protein
VHVDGTFLQANPEVAGPELTAYRDLMSEMHRTNADRKAAGKPAFSIGTVHAYVLDEAGQAVDSRHVAHAGPASITTMLKDAIAALSVKPGATIVLPKDQAPRPDAADDALVLHLTARYLVKRDHPRARTEVAGELVPRKSDTLGGERSGQWDALPSEDWIVLENTQWQGLIPELKPGASRSVDAALATIRYKRFYPTTEQNDLSKNHIEAQELTVTVLSASPTRMLARIDGSLSMKHAFYPGRDDQNRVEATLGGFLEFDPKHDRITRLQIATDRASFGDEQRKQSFGVALRNEP